MYSYEIIESDRLVRVTAQGNVDMQSSKDVFQAITADPRFRADFDFLVDVRPMGVVPEPRESHEFARFLGSAAAQGRFAVVAPPGAQYGQARMTASLAELQQVKMAVFRDSESALAWLKGPAASA